MAAVFRGNVIYADTSTGVASPPYDYPGAAPYDYSRNAGASSVQKFPVKLHQVIIINTATLASLQLEDGGNSASGIAAVPILNLAAENTTKLETIYNFPTPVYFPNGIIISTITNCVAHLVIEV